MLFDPGELMTEPAGIAEHTKGRPFAHRSDQCNPSGIVKRGPWIARATRGGFIERARFASPKDIVTIGGKGIEDRQCMALTGGGIMTKNVEPQLFFRAHADHFNRFAS